MTNYVLNQAFSILGRFVQFSLSQVDFIWGPVNVTFILMPVKSTDR